MTICDAAAESDELMYRDGKLIQQIDSIYIKPCLP